VAAQDAERQAGVARDSDVVARLELVRLDHALADEQAAALVGGVGEPGQIAVEVRDPRHQALKLFEVSSRRGHEQSAHTSLLSSEVRYIFTWKRLRDRESRCQPVIA
jgi:hypothetical protein